MLITINPRVIEVLRVHLDRCGIARSLYRLQIDCRRTSGRGESLVLVDRSVANLMQQLVVDFGFVLGDANAVIESALNANATAQAKAN